MKTPPAISDQTKTASPDGMAAKRSRAKSVNRESWGSLPRYCFNAVLMTALLAFAAIVFAALATGAAVIASSWHKTARWPVHHG